MPLSTAALKRLAELAEARDFDDICRIVQGLGSRWTPPSRDALMTLLRDAAQLK